MPGEIFYEPSGRTRVYACKQKDAPAVRIHAHEKGGDGTSPIAPFVTTAMVVVVEPGTSEVSALAPLGASLLVELDEVSVFEH